MECRWKDYINYTDEFRNSREFNERIQKIYFDIFFVAFIMFLRVYTYYEKSPWIVKEIKPIFQTS